MDRMGRIASGVALFLAASAVVREALHDERPPVVAAAPIVHAARLPVLGNVGDLPPEAGRVVIECGAAQSVVLNGQTFDISNFHSLRDLVIRLAGIADGMREPPPSNLAATDIVLRVDRDLPWGTTLLLLEICADPQVRAYRIHFAALPSGGGEEGAMAVFLPKDAPLTWLPFGPSREAIRLHLDPAISEDIQVRRDLRPFLQKEWAGPIPAAGLPIVRLSAHHSISTGIVLDAIDAVIMERAPLFLLRVGGGEVEDRTSGTRRGIAVTYGGRPIGSVPGPLTLQGSPSRRMGMRMGQLHPPPPVPWGCLCLDHHGE